MRNELSAIEVTRYVRLYGPVNTTVLARIMRGSRRNSIASAFR